MMFNNLSMQLKVIFLLALVAVIGIGSVLFIDTSLGNNIKQYNEMVNGPAPGTVAMARQGRHAAWTSRSILKAVLSSDETKLAKALDDLEVGHKKFNEENEAAVQFFPAKAEEVKAIRKAYESALSGSCAEVIALARSGQREQAVTSMDGGCGPELLDVMTKIATFVDKGVAENTELAARLEKQSSDNMRNANIVGIVGLLSAGAIGIWLTRSGISGPIVRLNDLMAQMSKGNLTVSIPGQERKDEIGAMSRTAEVFREGLAEAETLRANAEKQKAVSEQERRAAMLQLADNFEKSVGGIVSLVSSAATEMQAAAAQLSSTAQEASAQSVAVSAAAEEAGANVTSVASSAEELGASVNEIGRQVATSAQISSEAVLEADKATSIVAELNEVASSIGGVVDMIAGLASQTNLLALNATIKSARAGEAGRGFAVVASEVKALAGQTARATTEISSKIAQIQEATSRAAQAMQTITGTIQNINHTSTAIASAVEQQTAATQEIVQAVNQASMGTSEVTSNITGVAMAAEQTGDAASQVLASSGELAEQAERLHHEMDKFLTTVRAA
ncbi:hypothetical protein MMA231_02312 [Asticcacaulis sp. MM231]|uniref:methyl-accepting chemotaxis protein n=1 Tax=Asticcacaulis sp. MM231 TaxID=3157666 RepID=UPI0032D56A9F